MTTKIIGIKKFRENISSIWKEARTKKVKYVVMYHAKPIFELTPLHEEEIIFEKLAQDVKEARDQVKRGKVYTEEEVYKKLGL